jgi:hypothetical protein
MSGRRRLSAETMPMGMPTSPATMALAMTRMNVCGNIRAMYSLTG